MSNVWQMAAGDWARDYSQMLIDHDLMIMGPGEYGSLDDDLNSYEAAVEEGKINSSRLGMLKRFHRKAQTGDMVLLRRGYRVVAIGMIHSMCYEWDERFDDVYGWDLQHTRRVLWQGELAPELDRIQQKKDLFGDRKQIPTFTQVHDPRILEPVRGLLLNSTDRVPKPLPDPPADLLFDEDIGDELFGQGLSLQAVERLLAAISRQRRLLKWYRQHGNASNRPTEHEVVAFMVLPMLLSLGWSEQLLAVEWNRIDLAVFRRTPSLAENCVMVCEAKGMGHGLVKSLGQARNYVETLGLEACKKVLLTEGGRFYLFERGPENNWCNTPTGYFNVEKMRRRYVVPPDTDALETLMKLTPERVMT